jgi:signal peptidase
MTTLRIPAEQPWQAGHEPKRPAHPTAVRVGWVWCQRALLALAVGLFLGLGVLPRLGLYRPVTVLSGSMRPTFSPGDMVIVVPEPVSAVRVGQVISYQVPVGIHQVETHRIVRILQSGAHPTIQTQGDANNALDPWTAKLEGNTAWRMVAVLPHLGYVVNALRSRALQILAIFIVPALLALLVLTEIWGAGEDERERGPGGRAQRRAGHGGPARRTIGLEGQGA